MENLVLNLENCFGIKKLEHEFSFSNWKNVHIIYAQNGLMKTSFSNTFQAVSKGDMPEDRIFHNPTICEIKIDTSNPVNKDMIYVIHSFEQIFGFEQVGTLLVNDELRKKYEEQMNIIESEQEKLVSIIRSSLGRRSNEESISEFCSTFWKNREEFFALLVDLELLIDWETLNLHDAQIWFLLDPKVISIISDPVFKKDLDVYIDTYKKLLISTNFLRKWFNTSNAQDIADALWKKWFFDAEHSVNLKKALESDGELRIKSKDEFLDAIRSEQEKILADAGMKMQFEKLDKKLNTTEWNNFRNYLMDNIGYLEELKNPIEFKKKILISILQKHKWEYRVWLSAYMWAKTTLEIIIDQANLERWEWESVISDFHDKFDVPFTLEIRNQKDVILKRDKPGVYFKYDGKIELQRDELLKYLSQWEKRALYLLHIMFEIQARKKTWNEYLFIIDDIADSFDYRNKYAIIEYLNEISENPNFKIVILTHNFDFFRTIVQRNKHLWVNRTDVSSKNAVWMSFLNWNEVKINTAKDIRVFENLKDRFHKNEKLFLASIPFVRNLIEYSEGKNRDYEILTQALHGPWILASIPTNSDCYFIINRMLWAWRWFVLVPTINVQESVHTLIMRVSENIVNSGISEEVWISEKIILSIGIRLKTEEFIWSKIIYPSSWFGTDQTYWLIKHYQDSFPNEVSNIKVLKRVLLLISENIHLNSFMYEPLIDMNTAHLRKLYNEIKALV